ncbi:MAG: sensor histidine kinase [Flavobacteriaceae bacterium]
MKSFTNKSVLNWVIISLSFLMVSMILWNTYRFFQKFKQEERVKMENFSNAQIELSKTLDLDGNISDLPLKIIQSNNTTPMIIEDSEGNFQSKNIDLKGKNSQQYLKKLSRIYEKQNIPLKVVYKDKVLSTLYYGNSVLLNKLKYYPLALVLILILFLGLIYFFYRSSRAASQNKLWTAMAKETAHQIGTPLSSLIGWTELLKEQKVNPIYVKEIRNDISRLETITDRFSKIGSIPQLKPIDINSATKKSINYLKSRSSNLIEYEILIPEVKNNVDLNEELFGWTIENLVKNGIDAMKGKGKIKIVAFSSEQFAFIEISDTGNGIPKNNFKTVFETGYTTKKRGWGLGLSLTKRIIEQYHGGKIKVLKSEIGKGTTIQIALKKL